MNRTSAGARKTAGLSAWFFPREPRSFPGRRGLKILLRAAHVLCSGTFAAGYLFAAGAEPRAAWLTAAVTTGLLILLLDLHESGVFLLQLRGLIVLGKIVMLAAIPLLGTLAAWVLGALMVVSVVSSHAPSRFRYYVP